MSEEDLLLFRLDREFAISIGIKPPRCYKCNGDILSPPGDWNGKDALRHALPEYGCIPEIPREVKKETEHTEYQYVLSERRITCPIRTAVPPPLSVLRLYL